MKTLAELMEMEPIPELPPPAERRRLRRRFGFTQEGLAEMIGISIRTLYRWETGKDVKSPNDPHYRDYAVLLAAWKETERKERQIA